MTLRRVAFVVLSLLAGLAQQAVGATNVATDAAAERSRIAAERAQAEAAYSARAAECQQRFIVTSCMNEAQRQRRDALDLLRRQQVLLDEAERKQRAAARVNAIGKKMAAEAAPASAPAAPRDPLGAAAMRLRRPDVPASAPPQHLPAASDPAQLAAQERQRAARQKGQQARQAEVAEHRQAVEQRNAQRAASGKKPSAPLPVPSPLP